MEEQVMTNKTTQAYIVVIKDLMINLTNELNSKYLITPTENFELGESLGTFSKITARAEDRLKGYVPVEDQT